MKLKKIIPYLIICLSGILLVTGSLLIPYTIHEKAQYVTIEFGLPFKYVVQQQYTGGIGIPEGPSLPFNLTILSPWENPTQIFWERYFLDIIIVSAFLWLICIWINQIKKN